jgi:predicted nucleic acid-binding protein
VAFVIVYVDSSIVLRIVLEEDNPLAEWEQIRTGFASELLAIEVRRTLDRFWMQNKLTAEDFATKSADAESMLKRVDLLELDRSVLDRAARPFPTPLATLDAFHLATALRVREGKTPVVFATHDRELAAAARAMNFEVIGA